MIVAAVHPSISLSTFCLIIASSSPALSCCVRRASSFSMRMAARHCKHACLQTQGMQGMPAGLLAFHSAHMLSGNNRLDLAVPTRATRALLPTAAATASRSCNQQLQLATAPRHQTCMLGKSSCARPRGFRRMWCGGLEGLLALLRQARRCRASRRAWNDADLVLQPARTRTLTRSLAQTCTRSSTHARALVWHGLCCCKAKRETNMHVQK